MIRLISFKNHRRTKMKKIPVIMDVDTGIDDAVAIILAANSPELEILGITTVRGNNTIRHTTQNTIDVLALT